MKLRLGLIGLGDLWQTRYRPALRVLDDRFDVRAVYSTISKLAENAAAEFEADPIDGFHSLVQRGDIDAILVLKQCWLGWLPALAACRAGKAVYWAAGLDFDTEKHHAVLKEIEESGVSFMIELPRRFAPTTIRLKELIATHLGKPLSIRIHRQAGKTAGPERAEATSTPGGKSANDSDLVEWVDWCRYIVGHAPQSVITAGDPSSYQTMVFQFAGNVGETKGTGIPAGLDGSATRPNLPNRDLQPSVVAEIATESQLPAHWQEAATFRSPATMKIQCEKGVAFADFPSTLVWFDDAGRHVESLETESLIGQRMLRQFHRNVTSLVRDLGGLSDSYEASLALKAARESNETGGGVSIGNQ